VVQHAPIERVREPSLEHPAWHLHLRQREQLDLSPHLLWDDLERKMQEICQFTPDLPERTLDEVWEQEARRRLEQILQGQSQGRSAEDVFGNIRARFGLTLLSR